MVDVLVEVLNRVLVEDPVDVSYFDVAALDSDLTRNCIRMPPHGYLSHITVLVDLLGICTTYLMSVFLSNLIIHNTKKRSDRYARDEQLYVFLSIVTFLQ